MSEENIKAQEILQNACLASAVLEETDQEAVDHIVKCIAEAGFANRVKLARMAHEETQMGVAEHKVLKNVLATQMVYENIKDERTVGVIHEDKVSGITEVAQPLGPILAVIPVTNPTSTTMFKILIAIKTRNPVIISPHKRATGCCAEAARICYEAALKAGAPEYCIQWITEGSRELTHELMTHPHLALILATGGIGLVAAAYSSGTPALGVGPGNVPVFIESSADISFAVENVILSKTFDNGTICASEQAVVVEKHTAEEIKLEFEKQGCCFLTAEEVEKVEKVAVLQDTGTMDPRVVGQSADLIADLAGIEIPRETKILMAPQDKVGMNHPLSGEILAPILAYYVCEDFNDALKICIDLNYRGGVGHTAAIYSNDSDKINMFSDLMNAGRVIVNTPSAQGAVGGIFNALCTSFTLGCGSGGKNITTENITARHLLNIKKICHRRNNERWLRFPTEKYFDESISPDAIMREYNRNY